MDPAAYVAALEANAIAIDALSQAMPRERARWRPTPGAWSALEVVNHLADEEVEDFRARLDIVLHRPGETPPANDPEGWVGSRGYNGREFDESLARFLEERRRSLAWLRRLAAPVWSRSWSHPDGFALRAGDLLAAWAAHDLLHLRQLVELQYACRVADATPYGVAYAGDW